MKLISIFLFGVLTMTVSLTTAAEPSLPPLEPDVIFCIGSPDSFCSEFALTKDGYAAFPDKFPNEVVYEVGKSKPETDWAFLHPSKQDQSWAKGGETHPFTIKFQSDKTIDEPTTFIIGYMGAQGDLSNINIKVNETALPTQLPKNVGNSNIVFKPNQKGKAAANLFTIPAGTIKQGTNLITIVLEGKSWILYDYVALRKESKPLANREKPEVNMLAQFRSGENAPMKDVKQIVFTTRTQCGEHWYANIGYYASNQQVGDNPPAPNEGGRLCLLDVDTKQVEVLIDDHDGLVRDPCVHYDGTKILFSYKPAGTKYFHLYEMDLNKGTSHSDSVSSSHHSSFTTRHSLRQITDGEWDDIEPVYTPDDKIIFVSTRAKRWVNCWLTQVAILYGCDPDGSNIHPLSGNIEQDNTPWILPNGQVLYTRWEYVDRSQVHYHHLWTMNPDGTRQMVYFGNMHPGMVYIDAKPIPGSEKIVASFSYGHGSVEHAGGVGIIDPRNGPDDQNSANVIPGKQNGYRDPWAMSENCFIAATGDAIELFDSNGETQTLFRIPKEWQDKVPAGKVIREKSEVRTNLSSLLVHEPRPVIVRQRERIIGENVRPEKETGTLTLVDVYHGRNMEGVKRGEIKKLLILETLPMPIHYTGGMEPMTYGGSFTLERVVGTVPVDPDGSAHFELPALRGFFFVALDENDFAVKRMQSFLSVMPGENTACIGCHEQRAAAPVRSTRFPTAAKRPPSPITPIADYKGFDYLGRKLDKPTGIPDVISYPRDIQPIWDAHCVQCHSPEKRDGHFNLSGDRGPMYSISYSNIMTGTHSALQNEQYGKETLVADGRNIPQGNYPPRTLGSNASALLTKFCQPGHYDVKLSEREKTLVRLWIETGAAYLGTYAGLGSGMLGGYAVNTLDRQDLDWKETKAMQKTLQENCNSCHTKETQLPMSVSDEIRHTWWVYPAGPNDSRRKYSRHLFYDLTKPEKSVLLLAPLAKSAGGYESCGSAVFKDTNDPKYKTILAGIERAKGQLDTIKRFDMPDFQPRTEYLREMNRFGISIDSAQPVDSYDLDQRYWRSLWHKGSGE